MQLNKPYLSVLIPLFNEEKFFEKCLINLNQVLKESAISFELIVIESNSTDKTRELLFELSKKINLVILLQNSPLGKGNAIRFGLTKSKGQVISIYDGDLEYNPQDLIKLIKPIANGETFFTLGTRHNKGKMMRKIDNRLVLSHLMNFGHNFFTFIFNFLFKTKLTDPFTMYKVFRKDIFEKTLLVGNQFEFDLELVAKAAMLGHSIVEIPVSYRSRSFKEGKKVNLFSAPFTWIKIMLHCRFDNWRID